MEHEPKQQNEELEEKGQTQVEPTQSSVELTPEQMEALYAKEDDDYVKGQW